MKTATWGAAADGPDASDDRLARLEELAEQIFAASQAPLAVLGADLVVRRVNPAFCMAFALAPDAAEGRSIFEIGGAAWSVPELRRALAEEGAEGAVPDEVEVTHQRQDLGRRLLRVRARRLHREPGWLLAIEDVTDRSGAEEIRERLKAEARHRNRNLLAKITAIVSLSHRDQTSVAAYADRLVQRIGVFARTEDLIGSGGQVVEVRDLVAGELASVRGGDRAEVEGPPAEVAAAIAQPLALAVHELASNASCHGALHLPEARLRVTWSVVDGSSPATLRLKWEETGVPVDGDPAPAFGLRLIREIVPQMMGGTCSFSLAGGGLSCVLEFPLAS